jgi:hypothetical protein
MGSFCLKCGILPITKHLTLFGNKVLDFYNYIFTLFFGLRSILAVIHPYRSGTAGSLGPGERRDDCQCGAAGEAADGDQRRSP